ncbi:MAG: cation-translocating P-type ATPase [Burkholderiales bacterium]
MDKHYVPANTGVHGASASGLTSREARERLERDGPNALATAEQRSLAAIALSVLREPMFLLLCAAAGVYLAVGDLREALVLSASILVVLAITIVQERRTERALDALRDLSSPRARVIRDGTEERIAGADVVLGDLVLVAEGDRVPADARLVDAHELQVDESLLTGESIPVSKSASADQDVIAYSGTLVVSGRARGVVVATGARTELGRIGGLLKSIAPEKTMLERETARTVKLIGAFALAMCVAVALLYVGIRGDWLAGVLAGLTLAIAIIPEEFPVVLTVFLALGAWRIARRGVLTRRMPAIETLGAATVLCVDKTGTLTENRMALAEAYAGARWYKSDGMQGADAERLLVTAALACELDPFDPMDRALLDAAARIAPEVGTLRRTWQLEKDYGLNPRLLAMCHAWRTPDGVVSAAIKGAPESVLDLCRMDGAPRRAAMSEAESAAARGLRVLGVARATWSDAELPDDPSVYAYEWLGFVALADPLRDSVPAAVEQCRRAGVRVVMITGDYPVTALEIARQAGLSVEGGVVTGRELAAMDDAQCAQVVQRVNVFARILPEQKLRLVGAYKAAGEVVAMTGDGVNDAPALRAAHIGIAMGKRGTDVAREAAALVLTQDDFGAIVDTVRLGRRIYENIRNAMRYLISVHVPIAGMSFLPLLFGWPLFLFPVHVVFLEFVIDPACSIAFEAEPSEDDAMSKPPRDPREPLFNTAMLATAAMIGGAMLAAVALAYGWAAKAGYPEDQIRAIGFAAIVFGNVFLILAARSSDRSIIATLMRPNPALWWVIIATIAALALVLYVPPVAELFRLQALGPGALLTALAAGGVALLSVEAVKLLRRVGRAS